MGEKWLKRNGRWGEKGIELLEIGCKGGRGEWGRTKTKRGFTNYKKKKKI